MTGGVPESALLNNTLKPHAAITRLENPVVAMDVKLEMTAMPMSLVSYPAPCIASLDAIGVACISRCVYLE